MSSEPHKILEQRKGEIEGIISHVLVENEEVKINVTDPEKFLKKFKSDDQQKFHYFYTRAQARLHETNFIKKSPFFVRLIVQFDDKQEKELVYIGKFSFLPDFIYSWTAPIANLRFSVPGNFTYTRPNGEERSGVVFEREDYFIANGKIISLYEIEKSGRKMIYDEHISFKKSGFGLSDIVRELERAQNEIIILDPQGCMAISGPAGSGKTTLALHRMAYLLQNPDTSEQYKPEKSIVFIQDANSISYFSTLFNDLGVEGVMFTTFELWCNSLLDFSEKYTYQDRYGNTSVLQDWFEWNKVKLVATIPKSIKYDSNPWKVLDKIYSHQKDERFQNCWNDQKTKRFLDKQDLTALLIVRSYLTDGKVHKHRTIQKMKSGKSTTSKVKMAVEYDTVLVDEFENYTPAQLQIINTTFSLKTSCLFVGDIHQQTRLGSISDFSQSNITVSQERNIVLNKVYRNSAAIIDLIKALGYSITVNEQNKSTGATEWVVGSQDTSMNLIKEKLIAYPDQRIGVVCYDADNVSSIREQLAEYGDRVYIGSVAEIQGLEFETVVILDVNKDIFTSTGFDNKFDEERLKILKEQLYVAITRARNEVIICSDSEQVIIKSFL